MNIHADWQEFGKELDLLDMYMFVNWKADASITLALGLLLHEYLLSLQQNYRYIVCGTFPASLVTLRAGLLMCISAQK